MRRQTPDTERVRPFWDRPCAAPPWRSYRCRSTYGGWIMVGAEDDDHALREARRSRKDATRDDLQVWTGTEYVPLGQAPDTKPGCYYVTLVRGRRTAFLVGPFVDDHAGALSFVGRARDAAMQADPWAHFDAVGTSRTDYGCRKPGVLNDRVGYVPDPSALQLAELLA